MKALFYYRTPYKHIGVSIPQCFLDLDDYFDALFTDARVMFRAPGPELAENTCRRMADIDFYAELSRNNIGNRDPFRAATLTASFMVGYFSVCKSLLDACAIALAAIYGLSLSNKEKDFTKTKFWRELQSTSPATRDRYIGFKPLVTEVVQWRDTSVHRLTPLVVCHADDDPSRVPRDEVKIKMIANPEIGVRQFVISSKDKDWIDPLSLHTKWRPDFLHLCNEVCIDIRCIQR